MFTELVNLYPFNLSPKSPKKVWFVASVAVLRAAVCVAAGAVAVVRAPGLYPPYLGPLAIPPPANHPALFVCSAFLSFLITLFNQLLSTVKK